MPIDRVSESVNKFLRYRQATFLSSRDIVKEAKLLMDCLVALGEEPWNNVDEKAGGNPFTRRHDDLVYNSKPLTCGTFLNLLRGDNDGQLFYAFVAAWNYGDHEQGRIIAGLNDSTRLALNRALKGIVAANDGVDVGNNSYSGTFRMSEYDAAVVKAITEYQTPGQQIIYRMGLWATLGFALACGIMNGYPFIHAILMGTAAYPVLSFIEGLFLAGVVAGYNFWLTKNFSPNCLIALFGKDTFMGGLLYFYDEQGDKKPLSLLKQRILKASLFCAVSAGIVGGVLTFSCLYSCIISEYWVALTGFYFIPLVAAIGFALFCAVGFAVAFAGLLMSASSDLLGIEKIPEAIKNYLKEAVKDKNPFEIFLLGLTVALSIVLGCYGLFAWSLAGAYALTPMFGAVAAWIIAVGPNLLGQLLFTIRNAVRFAEYIASVPTRVFNWFVEKFGFRSSSTLPLDSQPFSSSSLSNPNVNGAVDRENKSVQPQKWPDYDPINKISPIVPATNALANAFGASVGFMYYVNQVWPAAATYFLNVMYVACYYNSAATAFAVSEAPQSFDFFAARKARLAAAKDMAKEGEIEVFDRALSLSLPPNS